MTDLLFEVFTILTGERSLPAAVDAFLFLSGGTITASTIEGAIRTRYETSYTAIRARAAQVVPVMDEFLAAHGNLAWNPLTHRYNFSTVQIDALAAPIEDVNSTRRYCADSGAMNVQQTLANVARLFRTWGTSSGEIAAQRARISQAMRALQDGERENKGKDGPSKKDPPGKDSSKESSS